MRLYLIRHGQSANNALETPRDRVQDPDLTELGYRQTDALAEHLASIDAGQVFDGDDLQEYGITHLYCSAMYRALLTARPVGIRLGLSPRAWVNIHESGGIYLDDDSGGTVGYPGKTRSEILQEFPDYVLPEDIADAGWWRCDFREERPAFYNRVIGVADQLQRWSDSDRHIALISHGDFMDSLLKVLLKEPLDDGIYHFHCNTGISRIDFGSGGERIVRYLNRVPHLSADLVS